MSRPGSGLPWPQAIPPSHARPASEVPLSSLLHFQAGTDPRFPLGVGAAKETTGKATVIGRQYFLRPAATLLKSALSTNDPKLAAALVERADDLLSQIHESGSLPDPSLQAPDVEPDRP